MDKFTVDLDQVLNDFEYSELTDQYNTVRNPIDTSSSANHSVTKHSINNVFHSLNEYLNTSIDVPSVTRIENNVKGVEGLDRGESGHSYNQTSIEDCIRNPDNKLEERNCDLNVSTSLVNADIKNNESKEDKTTIEENIEVQINTTVNNETYFKEDDRKPLPEQCKEMLVIKTEDVKDTDFIKQLMDDSSEENATDKSNMDILVKLDGTDPIANEVESKIVENFEDEDVEPRPPLEPVVEDIFVDKSPDEELLEEKIVDIEPVEENNVNIELEEDHIVNKNVGVIGFKAVTDIRDDEIDELLAELENDQDLIQDESQDVEKGKVEDVSKEEIHGEETEESREDLNPAVEEVKEAEQLAITKLALEADSVAPSDLEEPPKEPVKSEEQEVKDSTKDSNTHEVVAEKLEEESIPPSICETKIEEDQAVVEEEAVQEVEKVESAVDENVKEELGSKEESETKTEIQREGVKVERQDSASRPQHLELKEDENEKQREINLIGAPGSTPYNNVYVSEEIHKQEERDNESISSVSSNTFSDTGSSASTASTEEIRDDNDEDNSNNRREDRIIPTENLERGTRELSDDVAGDGNAREETSELSEGGEREIRTSGDGSASAGNAERQWLGKEAPLWIPDSDTTSCLHCDMKFTVLKRRHHCRACGLVLCSKCCHLRFKLEYLEAEARVCNKCHDILNKDTNSSSSSEVSPDHGNSPLRRPNPNNPLEYCSTISPLQQVAVATANPVPAVMVPVGVLKRKGSNKAKSNKSVMFCDGIRPGSDLTNLDNDFNYSNTKTKKLEKTSTAAGKINRNLPLMDSETNSFIPKSENSLPPLITITKTDISYTDCLNNPTTVESLKNNQLTFAILLSLYVHVKIINMSCCINKMAWCFSTEGLINVGQDEIVIILEYLDDESFVPKDIFYHINYIYAEAVKGTSIKELGLSLHNSSNFLDSKNHAGFVYIRPSFQCLDNVIKPKETFLVGILIHRWETPWAKLFPLRLILRLGAEYRYYPSPVISTRHRDSVFVEIGHTIINLLADFRNFSYTLPQINGLTIHMEDKNTTVTIPVNRYDQVIKSINNSSDHILAFAGTFSQEADSHLVCIQDTQGNENCYSTHAINIQNKPRKVTGASFIVFNGALKSSSGLTAKSNIVEDGLMIQVLPEHMQQIRDNLRAMKNHTIPCGCVNVDSDETVNIVWGENDVNFNIGITSSIDGMPLTGIPSIRVHNGKNYCANGNRIIRWTEVFIIQNGDDSPKNQDPVDVSRISESIAKATCDALLNYLDLLVTNNFQKIGIRTSLQADSVSYSAGSNNTKLPPIYMKSLDNELIPVLHRITSNNFGENAVILELIFRILNV